jgi:nucleotide-binding universal stress UspA family protein
MFRKIVIPLDGSPLAETVIEHIQRLMPPPTTQLVVVSVFESYRYGLGANEIAAVDAMGYVREGMETYLKQQHERLEEMGYETQAYLTEGDAAQGILEVADSVQADLIAMTTHGRSGIARWAIGSVTERIMHYAKQPIFLTRQETRVAPRDEIEKVMVTLDGTDLAEQALAPAQKVARELAAELLLLRVTPQFEEAERELLFDTESAAEDAMVHWRHNADHYLEQMVQELAGKGLRVRSRIVSGYPEEAIVDAAAVEDVDLLVMCTHGRIGFDRLLHGSIASEVARHVICPLILVRAHEASGATESERATQQSS